MNLPSPSSGSVLFSSLPSWRVPRSEFLVSYGLQAAIAALFFWVPILTPPVIRSMKDYHAIQLVPTPVPESHEAQRTLAKPVLAAKLERIISPAEILLAAPRPKRMPLAIDALAPEIQIPSKKLEMPTLTAPSIPRQVVRTNLFSSGSSAAQKIERPVQQVQTGGFGDPSGISATKAQTRAINIAQVGGFDLPNGDGIGNGRGRAQGVRGVVASAGFGSGTATDSRSQAAAVVRDAGFDSDVAVPAGNSASPREQTLAKMTPAEILSKPVPIYTDEARAKRIEGEVLLEVVFQASGTLLVVRVVHGLGHGLDDSAVRAAEQIRFRPAFKNGQPSDSTAVVHIIFQLA